MHGFDTENVEVRVFMDRKQAQSLIGKMVMIDENQEGRFFGTLIEVIAPPRKTWRGKIEIKAVAELPIFKEEGSIIELESLKYTENEIIECNGSKLSIVDEEIECSYKESLTRATMQRWNELDKEQNKMKRQQHALTSFVSIHGLDLTLQDDYHAARVDIRENEQEQEHVVTYTFKKQRNQYILIDGQNEVLELEGCPFEFEWTHNGKSFIGFYEEAGTFISKDGERYSPKIGAAFSIDKKQFDPYFILRNELEPAALESFEKSLQSHGLTHENIVDCHNALLGQLLNAEGNNTFQGVNFLTFRGKQGVVMVQHHFNRTLHDHSNDEIYDRFEFTTEQGKRAIVTYTNEFSR